MAGQPPAMEVPEDAAIQKVVWEGNFPLRIQLEAKEVTTLTPPPPLFLMAPRLGYLPLLASKIEPHFRAALPPGTDAIWFEYRGLPLKWHIPTGVLYDLLAEEKTLPWQLTVHFRTYPSELIPIEGEETVKWSYMNALKEAVYIMHGSTKPVMSLSQKDQEELWRSLAEGDFNRHTSSAASLGVSTSSRPRSVPLRLYLRQAGTSGAHVKKWEEIAVTTRCADVMDSGSPATLGGALHKAVPHLFDEGASNNLPALATELGRRVSGLEIEPSTSRRNSITEELTDSPRDTSRRGSSAESPGGVPSAGTSGMVRETSEEGSGGVGSESTTPRGSEAGESDEASLAKKEVGAEGGGEVHSDVVDRSFPNGLVVRIQGTEPRWDVPLNWLSRNLSHPDHFLHISVWRREAGQE
ncbi:autophagy protein 5 [Klebsormidium nitens]|uniref:Autophagy protein 5 n=1 Tax=Klebsormidium nitens TaxID=105231 RepID=A0A1Y1I5R9_KLENI|nr:autophagy protein 5 [Klebsormidium nitens]|eukprot:GAQ86304.1 autophagy protein 5 [Klebsormidium nitens]